MAVSDLQDTSMFSKRYDHTLTVYRTWHFQVSWIISCCLGVLGMGLLTLSVEVTCLILGRMISFSLKYGVHLMVSKAPEAVAVSLLKPRR